LRVLQRVGEAGGTLRSTTSSWLSTPADAVVVAVDIRGLFDTGLRGG
jgi:hypothetical protein